MLLPVAPVGHSDRKGKGESIMAQSKITNLSKGDRQFEAVIESVERMNNSVNGNPAWRLHLKGGETMRTQSDAQVSYGIENQGMIGFPVIITCTRSGLVWAIEPIAELEGGK